MWHPFLISILVAELVGVLFLIASANTAVRVLLGWSPGSADRSQIALEIKMEVASIRARMGYALFVLATGGWVVAIALILPGVVPGAMCGTGVIQATQGAGGQALILRGLGLVLLFVWHLLDKLNRARPEAPLTLTASRALLVALPVVLLAAVYSFRTTSNLDTHQPVDCCAVVSRQARDLVPSMYFEDIPNSCWILGFVLGGLAIIVAAVLILRYRTPPSPRLTGMLGLLAWGWMVTAAITLIRVLTPYHYGVLQHHCPWCLMLPEHGMLGFVHFSTLAVVVLEATGAYVCTKLTVKVPSLSRATSARCRRAAASILVACVVFFLSAGLPAVVWRLKYGVWL